MAEASYLTHWSLGDVAIILTIKRCNHISYHIMDFVPRKKTKFTMEQPYHAYPKLSIPFLLMPWQLKEPGHQQAWYWSNKPEYSVSGIRRVKSINFKFIVQNSSLSTHSEIALRWMPQSLTNDKSTLVQVMAWCCQATMSWAIICFQTMACHLFGIKPLPEPMIYYQLEPW